MRFKHFPIPSSWTPIEQRPLLSTDYRHFRNICL
uniref:Uncharacterized protein n=1 Tax=Siphoviridae sp. ctDuC3 TaxID=2827563 RepID=A0A8S5LMV7_9CAUD|nr:MAG TPA: hypothetical protein [Siphoviridae sp. ctDuC3]